MPKSQNSIRKRLHDGREHRWEFAPFITAHAGSTSLFSDLMPAGKCTIVYRLAAASIPVTLSPLARYADEIATKPLPTLAPAELFGQPSV